MNVTHFTLAYEEKLSEPTALPTRATTLEVDLASGPPWTGRAKDAPRESIDLAVEVSVNGGAYEERCRLGPLSEPGVYKLEMPRAPEAEDDVGQMVAAGTRRSTFRIRLIHDGRMEPRFRARVLGM